MKKFKTNIIAITIITTIIIIIFTIGYIIGKNKATNEIWENNRHTETIVVKSGDTLWSIAEEYKPNNVDVREYIHDIKKLNKMSDSAIHGGDTILVYIYGHNTKDDIILEVHNND